MKVILTNFKCYAYREFVISENEITLIHGPSGIGKSTICAAINFVLFGSGSKVVKHDKNSCSVEVIFEDGRIFKRSKRPNFLSVTTQSGSVYTDDAAQEIINKDFGSAFDITGYLEQGSSNSFLLMTPASKSEFLERFAFRDVDLSGIKDKSKVFVKEMEVQLDSIQRELKMLRNLKEDILKKVEKPDVNFEYLSTKNEAQLQGMLDAHVSELKEIDKKISELKQIQTEIVILNASMADKKAQLSHITAEKAQLDSELKEVSSKQLLKEEIANLQEQLYHINHVKKVRKVQEDLDLTISMLSSSKKIELEQHSKRVQEVQHELDEFISKFEKNIFENEDEISRFQNIFSQICSYKSSSTDCLSHEKQSALINTLTSDLGSLEVQKAEIAQLVYKLESQLSILTCPSCDSLLRKIDDCLVSVNDPDIIESDDLMADIYNNKKELTEISKKISSLQKSLSCAKIQLSEIAKLDELLSSFQEKYGTIIPTSHQENVGTWIYENQKFVNDYISGCKKNIFLKKEFQKLQNFTFSDVVKIAEKKSETKKKELDQLLLLCPSLTTTTSESQIYQTLSEQDAIEKAKTSLMKRLTQSEHTLSTTKAAVDDLEYKLRSFNVDENNLASSIAEKYARKAQLQTAHDETVNVLRDFRKYFDYNHFMSIVNSYTAQIDQLIIQEQLAVEKLTGANKLKDLISEAEGQAISSLINSINSHARLFLDDFFPENPISVLLNPFKEVKKGSTVKSVKSQINVEIEYKEMSCGLDSLSGGEVARISLAYTLALAEMINSPILMLDECTSSLDADMSSVVMESIKTHMPNKTIIVIAHQAEVGSYDNVISLV